MKKLSNILLLVCLLFGWQDVAAQTIVRSTLCATGVTQSNSTGVLTSTFGSCPGCGTLSSSDPNGGYITPGFQQNDNDVNSGPCFTAGFDFEEMIDDCNISYNFSYEGSADLNAVEFEWDFGASAIPQTSNSANPQGIYFTDSSIVNVKMHVIGDSCQQIKITSLAVRPISSDCDLVVEDVISPNGDGQNDTWRIIGIEQYPNNEVTVFNRWGQQVWKANGYLNDWTGTNKNGEPLPVGAYYYVLKLNDADRQVISGSVTIVR